MHYGSLHNNIQNRDGQCAHHTSTLSYHKEVKLESISTSTPVSVNVHLT